MSDFIGIHVDIWFDHLQVILDGRQQWNVYLAMDRSSDTQFSTWARERGTGNPWEPETAPGPQQKLYWGMVILQVRGVTLW